MLNQKKKKEQRIEHDKFFNEINIENVFYVYISSDIRRGEICKRQ